MRRHGNVLIFRRNGDGCVASYWRRLCRRDEFYQEYWFAATKGRLLIAPAAHGSLLQGAVRDARRATLEELSTELAVFMHYVGILVGVTVPTRDVLLCHFRKMLLYAWGYAVAYSYFLCTLGMGYCKSTKQEVHDNTHKGAENLIPLWGKIRIATVRHWTTIAMFPAAGTLNLLPLQYLNKGYKG